MNNKVVYAWFENEECFYIGIGTLKRSRICKKSRNPHTRAIAKRAKENKSFRIQILHSGLSTDAAAWYEIKYINLIGRSDLNTGTLTNKSNGGEGSKRYGVTYQEKTIEEIESWKLKISNTLKGNIPWNKGKKMKQSTKDKLREHNTGKKFSEETKDKMRKAHKGRPAHNKRQCVTPFGLYDSIENASVAHNMSISGIRNRITSINYPDYYFSRDTKNGSSSNP